MNKKLSRTSNISIYVTYFLIFLFGGMLFIIGLYLYDKGAALLEHGYEGGGLIIAGIILIALGVVFVVLSFIYSRFGAKVIRTNCPYCHGTGYVDSGLKKNARRETCPICSGTGKMLDEKSKYVRDIKKKKISENEH
ncbi:MAG: hypothetical protein ACTSX6_08290 [Candidatus Heimdallarchaeaceae archaeon]